MEGALRLVLRLCAVVSSAKRDASVVLIAASVLRIAVKAKENDGVISGCAIEALRRGHAITRRVGRGTCRSRSAFLEAQ